jgi:hypothetical protein
MPPDLTAANAAKPETTRRKRHPQPQRQRAEAMIQPIAADLRGSAAGTIPFPSIFICRKDRLGRGRRILDQRARLLGILRGDAELDSADGLGVKPVHPHVVFIEDERIDSVRLEQPAREMSARRIYKASDGHQRHG